MSFFDFGPVLLSLFFFRLLFLQISNNIYDYFVTIRKINFVIFSLPIDISVAFRQLRQNPFEILVEAARSYN